MASPRQQELPALMVPSKSITTILDDGLAVYLLVAYKLNICYATIPVSRDIYWGSAQVHMGALVYSLPRFGQKDQLPYFKTRAVKRKCLSRF